MTRSTLTLSNIPKNKLRAIQITLAQFRQLLRLQSWDIEVSRYQPLNQEHLMEISIKRRRRHAAIRINDIALDLSVKKFNEALMHELVHILFEEMDYAVDSSKLATDYEEARERAVDHIAKVMYAAISN